jgi:hypothetical protein
MLRRLYVTTVSKLLVETVVAELEVRTNAGKAITDIRRIIIGNTLRDCRD